ncbi:MAG TPA: bifunctional 3-(3-hydroxy-phenyl)propionate/3-hydroxycinnamic acid hydroxylase [Solirubrobacterales bacterium]
MSTNGSERSSRLADVAVIGAGPVGLTLAALLARNGVDVVVVERYPSLYNLPRAGHIDHEVMRVLQNLGCHTKLLEDAIECGTYELRNVKGELLLEFPWGSDGISGWHSDYMMYQPVLEDALDLRVMDDPRIVVHRGFEVFDLREGEDRVEVFARRPEAEASAFGPAHPAETVMIEARYVVAADGGRSVSRDLLGIEREDLGYSQEWLNVDCRRRRPVKLTPDSGQLCDPRRPTTFLPLGKRHRRFEWILLPGESPEEMSSPTTAWRLMAEQGLGAADVTIVRQHVWKFEARLAREWRRGRVMLAGDAAHTMPPFQGQGMCSGVRDATNLAWKLKLVLDGIAPDSLLDTYEAERKPHVRAWTLLSIETGEVLATLDPEEAERRDEAHRSGQAKGMTTIPPLDGIVLRGGDGVAAPGAGSLGLQARVAEAGRVGLFDDVVGGGFGVVSVAGDPGAVLDGARRARLEALGARVTELSGADSGTGTVDVDGRYSEYFQANDWEVVVTRPDFYVFGGGSLSELPHIVDSLLSQIEEPRVDTGSLSGTSVSIDA